MGLNKHAGDPFTLLCELEARSKRGIESLTRRSTDREYWTGIGFRLGDTRLVTALDEVTELIHEPALTPVPGTLDWLSGVANLRGSLLPVIDLQCFFGGNPIVQTKKARVLVIRHGELTSGVMVPEVYGLKHFPAEDRLGCPQRNQPGDQYVDSEFPQADQNWGVFSMRGLAESPRFQRIANT